MATHNELGKWGEEIATAYLTEKGYFIIGRDWKSGRRDIDIIAMDGATVVFVEVKTRRNSVFTDPEMAVNYEKIENLRVAANHFIKIKQIDNEVRFDVIAITGTPESGYDIRHIEDAF